MTKPFHKLYDKSKLYCEDLKECDFIFSDRESVGTRHIAFLRCDFTRSHTDYLLAALIIPDKRNVGFFSCSAVKGYR